jgi:hypothetical protein
MKMTLFLEWAAAIVAVWVVVGFIIGIGVGRAAKLGACKDEDC